MGLIGNLLISVIHLIFIVIDILFLTIILKIIYDHWQVDCLEPIMETVAPVIDKIIKGFAALIHNVTGKFYPRKTLLALLVLSISVFRLVLMGLF